MTTKSTPSPAHLATSALFTPPPSVNLDSFMLAAEISLPPNAVVLYKIWRPATPEALEAARRTLVTLRATAPESDILGNVLYSASLERGAEQLYAFAVDASDGHARARKQLAELRLDNMDGELRFLTSGWNRIPGFWFAAGNGDHLSVAASLHPGLDECRHVDSMSELVYDDFGIVVPFSVMVCSATSVYYKILWLRL